MRILEKLPDLRIFLLIYINKILDKIIMFNLKVISLFFVNDFGFIIFIYSIKNLTKTL